MLNPVESVAFRSGPGPMEETMASIDVNLVLHLVGDGTVNFVFSTNHGGNSRPIAATNLADAEQRLVSSYGFAPQKAKVLIAKLAQERQVESPATIDETVAATLVFPRVAGA